jgi:predicted nucleotidyltransferase
VDLMVEFEPDQAPSLWEFPEMQKAFSALFGGRRVDLVPPQVLDNPYRRKSILPDLKVLYGG